MAFAVAAGSHESFATRRSSAMPAPPGCDETGNIKQGGVTMATEAEADELNVEEETDEVPYVEFDISVSPSDPTLELLAQQIARDDIIIPFYQRKYVWKIEQASKLIESFLMGLPVPQVFLYVNEDDRLEVIDGQQRLMSVKYFMDGFFGDEDDKERKQVFKLKGLSERSDSTVKPSTICRLRNNGNSEIQLFGL
jgi:hypothetical protein